MYSIQRRSNKPVVWLNLIILYVNMSNEFFYFLHGWCHNFKFATCDIPTSCCYKLDTHLVSLLQVHVCSTRYTSCWGSHRCCWRLHCHLASSSQQKFFLGCLILNMHYCPSKCWQLLGQCRSVTSQTTWLHMFQLPCFNLLHSHISDPPLSQLSRFLYLKLVYFYCLSQ